MKTIEIQINNQAHQVADDLSVAALIEELQLGANPYYAIAINDQIIPRSTYAQRKIQAHDRLLVVTAQGGG